MDRSDKALRRRDFLRAAAAGAVGAVAVGCTVGATQLPATAIPKATTAPAAEQPVAKAAPPTVAKAVPPQQAAEPRVDRVLKNGVLRVGVDLTFPPLQFRDASTNEPKGMMAEIDQLIAQELGVKLEYVEIPFGELIAGLLADKFDWIGIAFTATPKRGQQVLFIDEPTFFEDSFLLLKKGTQITNLEDLNKPEVTFSNLSGSAQDASARILFPKATFKPLGFPENVLEVAAGRSDACLIAIWNAAEYIAKNPGTVDVWKGGSLFSDMNTLYVPSGDYKTKEYLGNLYRYYEAHGWFKQRFDFWMTQLSGYTELQKLYAGK